MKNTFIFRCDANEKIGAGHVMRCLALAQQCIKKNGTVFFVMAKPNETLENRLNKEGINTHWINTEAGSKSDAQTLISFTKEQNSEWIILDGYHFDDRFQHRIKNSNIHLLCVDDYAHATFYHADIILNQNIYADESLYPNRQSDTKLQLGAKYILLRNEFLNYKFSQPKLSKSLCHIMVTMGGSDPFNITASILKALIPVPNIKVKALVGPCNPHMDLLQSLTAGNQEKIELLKHINNMPALMDWADISINAGGSTCYELIYSGVLPIVITCADNQILLAEILKKKGYIHYLGWYENINPQTITTVISKITNKETFNPCDNENERLVDGLGSERIHSQINSV